MEKLGCVYGRGDRVEAGTIYGIENMGDTSTNTKQLQSPSPPHHSAGHCCFCKGLLSVF